MTLVKVILASVMLWAWGQGALAEARFGPQEARLFEAMGMDDLVEILAEEGATEARALPELMFPNRLTEGWERAVAQLYAPARHMDLVQQHWPGTWSAAQAQSALAFYQSPLGARIAAAEILARRAMMDPEAEALAYLDGARIQAQDGPRAARIARIITAYDLIEGNVSGALNASLAFYRGLRAVDALPAQMGAPEILAEVAGQAEQIRLDTTDWLYAYLTLSYAELSGAELEAYLGFIESGAGQALNQQIFVSFGTMFEVVSEDLGALAGRWMASEDL